MKCKELSVTKSIKKEIIIEKKIFVEIGNIQLPEKPLFLAPMEDVSDRSFRYICKQFGADMVYTEFVASEALIRNVKKTIQKLKIEAQERPIGIQLYGHNIEPMVESARIVAEFAPDVIDINYGCPVKKIATRGAGAGLLRDVPKMIRMTTEIVKAVKIPVTVKTRLGWDTESINITEVAEMLQDTGIKALTIHGRTRSQMYKGTANWQWIGNVKNNPKIKIPIIGNGDINSAQKAGEAFDKYGVDGIMIGRATIGCPWIFREIKHYLTKGEIPPPLTLHEKVEIAKLHFKKSIEVKENMRGIYEMRRHFATYFKSLPHFKELRLKLLTATEPKEIIALLDTIDQRYSNYQ